MNYGTVCKRRRMKIPPWLLGIHRSEWLVEWGGSAIIYAGVLAQSTTADLQAASPAPLLPPSLPPFPLGRRVGKLHRRWSSGALGLELLVLPLQVHLHLSRCSAALPGIIFALCDSVSLSFHSFGGHTF